MTDLEQERQTATRFGHVLAEKEKDLEAEIAAVAADTASRICEGRPVGEDALNLIGSLAIVKKAIVVSADERRRLDQQIVAEKEAEYAAELDQIKSAKDAERLRLAKAVKAGRLVSEDGYRNKMHISPDGEIIIQDLFESVMESLGPENGPKHLERMREAGRTQSYFAHPKS